MRYYLLAMESAEVPPTSSCSHYFNTPPLQDIFGGETAFKPNRTIFPMMLQCIKDVKRQTKLFKGEKENWKYWHLLTSKNGLTVSILYSSLKLSSLSRERKHCRRVKMGKQILAKSSLLLTMSPCMNCLGYSTAERRSSSTTQSYRAKEERFCFA